jgi:26S proteasome regulatory subunit N5
MYYKRITYARLTQLLDLSMSDVESFLSTLVSNGTIQARIDRPAKTITFSPPQNPEAILSQWSLEIQRLLGLIEKTTHLITKEEMVHKILAPGSATSRT